MKKVAVVLLCCAALTTGALAQAAKQSKTAQEKATMEKNAPGAKEIHRMMARFAPTELKVDISHLSDGDRKALVKLIEAARVIDDIFLEQYWAGNHALFAKLQKDTTPLGRARLQYFWVNKSPWSSLDQHKAFLPGVPPEKLKGANFYPEDMTKEEFEGWVKTLPEDQRQLATGFFSVIRRGADKKLTQQPFSQAYKAKLSRGAGLLREAAALTNNATLKNFLNKRAEAYATNNYYESDVAWMDLDAPIDVTIGPYETYNDEIFGYKASYEAYINIRDDKETNKVAAFSKVLQQIENNLPIDEQYRNPKLGASAPIRVVNEVFAAGDGNHGVQTAAYNLPNDERVTTERGTKRVMLRNVQEAKFQKVLVPIAKVVLAPEEQGDLSFDSFFTHILAHELSHGIGPHRIKVNGAATTPREQLKELYGGIEEAKADVLGLYALQYMMDHRGELGLEQVVPAGVEAERQLYTTFLASSFRTLGFGIHEAHGRGMAVQVNYLMDKGAVTARQDGTFAVDFGKIKGAVRDLAHDLLMLEATGDYNGAKKMLDELAVIRPPLQKALDRAKNGPTDIRPVFVTAEQIAGPYGPRY